jgi:hypothetical protein
MKNNISTSSSTSDSSVSANLFSNFLDNSSKIDIIQGSESKTEKNDIDIKEVEAVIADNCNSVFEGKIGTQNICIAIHRDGDVLTASYIAQSDQDSEINLQGTIQTQTASFILNSRNGSTFMGKIEPETKEGTLLEGTYTSAKNEEDNKLALTLSHTIGNTYESRYPLTNAKTRDIEEFASKIKLYVTENNKKGLSDLISYPIKVNINGSKQLVSNKEEFEQKYDDIMNVEFKEQIKNCYTKYLFSNSMGIMLGNGEIWFENLNNYGLRVYAINN